jgi:hypothetical protein
MPAAAAQSAQPLAHVAPQTLFSVKDLVRAEPALTLGGIRDDLFNRRKNVQEATGAVIRRGRRLLIVRDLYMQWLMARGRAA